MAHIDKNRSEMDVSEDGLDWDWMGISREENWYFYC